MISPRVYRHLPKRWVLFLAMAALVTFSVPTAGVESTIDDDVDTAADLSSDSSNSPDRPENLANDGLSATRSQTSPLLTEESVVLITGAAGFLGSELALALRRTYGVKKLLLVDDLGVESENERAYVPPVQNSDAYDASQIHEKVSEDMLTLFEYRRQRLFRIFHELTAPSLYDENDEAALRLARKESIKFYRSDMRPSIPEFFDFGEVPLLDGIFQTHPDITHVVHLADVPQTKQWENQAVPRNRDSFKAGRMESILEEFRLIAERNKVSANANEGNNFHLPHFLYASSSEVYDRISTAENDSDGKKKSIHNPNPPPFREDLPITTPSSLRGAAKLIDEVLASSYHSTHGIYSVGLRFFEVYGPWSTPGTEVFELVERIAAENDADGFVEDDNETSPEVYKKDLKDYVFIDDAIDAIMAAMQYRPPGANPPPVVFNVGSGTAATLENLEEKISQHFPKLSSTSKTRIAKAVQDEDWQHRRPTTSVASTDRSKLLLGFSAQVSLEEGLAYTISWHRERASPYGRDPKTLVSLEQRSIDLAITANLDSVKKEICSPLDWECLRGIPVFPCSSECHNAERCTPSAWDTVAALSTAVTTGCDVVMYTILLDENAEQIPSATTVVNFDSSPFVGAGLPADLGQRTTARCNIAFVSESSPLFKKLISEGEKYVDNEFDSNLPPLLRHGFWTVLPVKSPSKLNSGSDPLWMHAFSGTYSLEYLPKLSPGRFFGPSVRYAVYSDPSILLDNLPKLLRMMDSGPTSIKANNVKHQKAAIGLLLLEKNVSCDPTVWGSSCSLMRPDKNDAIQSSVYNTIRIALRGELLGGGSEATLDSSFLIHALHGEDPRLLRCDIYTEVAQWGVNGDERALEFIVSLHNLWSKAVTYWMGEKPWWASNESLTQEKDGENSEKESDVKHKKDNVKSPDVKGTLMGILSSTNVQLFTHVVSSEGMGIAYLENYQR